MARGKFISVVDSDDYIDKNFYKIAREYINNYDVIIYDLYVVFEKIQYTITHQERIEKIKKTS